MTHEVTQPFQIAMILFCPLLVRHFFGEGWILRYCRCFRPFAMEVIKPIGKGILSSEKYQVMGSIR